MIKKVLILAISAVLTIGAATIAYADGNDNREIEGINRINTVDRTASYRVSERGIQRDMLDIMKENGYGDIVDEVRNGNYEAMDEFMNNISEEDFEEMINIMRENGYEGMARRMERFGREGMIEMHNAIGGAQSCHGDGGNEGNGNFTGMMGQSF